MNTTLKVSVNAIAAWGTHFENWSQLQRLLAGEALGTAPAKSPKPQRIPANERRRAPVPARLAVEVCDQAATAAGMNPEDLACVFSSGLGDTDLTHYMCKELAGEHKQLSPTKFHNSVHNAPAGYWTIATGCQQPANSVAGLNVSVSIALLEGIVQCVSEQLPVILAFYDTPTSPVLTPLFSNSEPFAAAIVISPITANATHTTTLQCCVEEAEAPRWSSVALPSSLENLYQHNPAARALPLLQAIASDAPSELALPLSPATQLRLTVAPS